VSIYFTSNKKDAGLGGQAIRSGIHALTSRLVIAVIQIVTTIILARLLAPADFGLVAIVAALTSFVPMLIDLGLTDSTVQNDHITPEQISGLFWLSLATGTTVAVLLLVASPAIASIYKQPSLSNVAAAWAATFVLYALSLQHMALLRRAMKFRQIAGIEITASVCGSGVTIMMAYFGFGYWALVMRPVISAAITAAGSWIGCGWRPGPPRLNADIKPMLKYGLNVTGGAVVWIGCGSADRATMGFVFSPTAIGLYQNALMLYENALQGISIPLHKVGVSALSKLRAEPKLLAEKYLSALSVVSFYSMPAFALLSVVSADLVPFLLGEKWRAGGAILSIMALRGLFQIVENSQTWLHMPLGRPERWIRWAILTGLVQVFAVFVGLPFGVEGVALSIVIARGLLAFPAVLYAGRPLDLRFITVIKTLGPQLAGAVASILAGKLLLHFVMPSFGPVLRMAAASAFCGLVYFGIVVGIFRSTEPLRLVISLAKRFIPARFHARLPFATAP